MPQLHELLAVEQSLATNSANCLKSVTRNLSGKSLFSGLTKSHERFAEDEQHLTAATEVKEVQSTVDMQLDFLTTEMSKYFDTYAAKEATNQTAKADIIIDGRKLAENVPATVLLGMESKLAQLVEVYKALPTLDASVAWEAAPEASLPGIFRTKHAVETFQTQTEKKYNVVTPATQHQQAIVDKYDETTNVGKYTRVDFSGAITSFDKAERIARLGELIRAVKKARQRANQAEIVSFDNFGSALFSFINKG